MKANEIRIERISEDGHIIEEGYLNLNDMNFHPLFMVYAETPKNIKCPQCKSNICNCPKPVQ